MENKSSILLMHKPPGVTSFSSLNPVKRFMSPHVGHAGTLDKFAEGLMIVLTGRLTRLNTVFSGLDKKYQAVFFFGTETDTLDPEGQVVGVADIPPIQIIEEKISQCFIGPILQRPPAFSAVHINGKRAHVLARSGKDVAIPERPVTVYSFEITDWSSPLLTVDIHVSKGTYIRSLARDLGHACGSRCHVVGLKRTAIGPFELSEAIQSTDSEAMKAAADHVDELLFRLNVCGRIDFNFEAEKKFFASGTLPIKEIDYLWVGDSIGKQFAVAYGSSEKACAVFEVDEAGQCVKCVARL